MNTRCRMRNRKGRIRSVMKAGVPAALALLLAIMPLATALPAQAAPTGSALHAWYTTEQADFGRRMFNTHCAACHGSSMLTIFRHYSTVERYYNYASGSMPKHLPGTLPESDYLSIVAYLLRASGFPPGDTELTSERPLLRQIVPADGLSN